MDRNKLLQIIQKNLDELSEINREMSRNDKLSNYEVDLAFDKAKLILKEYEILQEINQQHSQTDTQLTDVSLKNETTEILEKPEPAKVSVQEKVLAAVKPEDSRKENIAHPSTGSSSIEVEESENVEVEIPHPEPVPVPKEVEQPIAEDIRTSQTANSEIRQEVIATAPPMNGKSIPVEKKTLTDQFHSKSLNDLLTATNKLDQKFASGPIAKLGNAIGLNDRFQYIRELFGNDADLFRETIGKLDRMHTVEEAVEHLDKQFNWEKNDTSLQFIHLVKRRFSV